MPGKNTVNLSCSTTLDKACASEQSENDNNSQRSKATTRKNIVFFSL